ncbi:hypothetical protein [Paludisphaera rhizosphaerae]|uniref:hypothetical protein n=1 Tax=Paludisphaera rhizosphaerae TaxID=2711216 RepID=UPI0013EE256E|nr:hypothetical protein [Paludisphaera rhizosphaerae]
MAALLEQTPMAGDKPRTLSVKLEMDVVESARIVTAYRDESMTELLSAILRPVLAQMEQEEMAKRMKATRKTKGNPE